MEKFIAIVVKDNWHLANNQHFGEIIYDYDYTPILFNSRMEAIQNAFNSVQNIYKGVKIVGKLEDKYNNELNYHGSEFHIISFSVRDKE